MIFKRLSKRTLGLISTVLVATVLSQWLLIPEIQWNSKVIADSSSSWSAMNQDSSSLVNFATVLRGAVDYGIVSNSINQQNHMETTYATYTFINPNGGNNNDVDFLDRDKTAHFLIGSVASGSRVRFGQATAQTFNIQAPSSVFDGFVPTQHGVSGLFELDDNFFTYRTPSPQIVTASPSDTNSNIERLINRGVSQSQWLSDRANNPAYQLPSTYITNPTTNSIQVDITDPIFDNRVVYINVTAEMLEIMRNTGDVNQSTLQATQGLVIRKNPSSVVVFNIEDSVVDDVFGADNHYVTSKYIVVSGSDIMESQTASSGGTECQGKSTVNYQGIDTGLCQTVIWNIRTNNDVDLDTMAGTILIPEHVNIDLTGGHSAGWLLTSGDVQLHKEFHYIYGGSSSDGEDEMHFAIRKAFTANFANDESVIPDYSVVFDAGDFNFVWQEYTDSNFTTAVGSSSNRPVTDNSDVEMPVLTFYTDDAHAGAVDTTTTPPTYGDDCDPHYILPGNARDFYFRITESSSTIAGITNSGGDVKIRLRVTADALGNLSYKVQSVTTTGVDGSITYATNGLWLEENDLQTESGIVKAWVDMSGVRFDLGAFYNRVDTTAPGSLTIVKNISGYTPTEALRYTFNVYSEENNTKTYYAADGATSSDPVAIYVDVPANTTTGTSLINNLPVGKTYTVVEVNPEAVIIDNYTLVAGSHTATGVLSGSIAFANITNTYVRNDSGAIALSKAIGSGNAYDGASTKVYKVALYQENYGWGGIYTTYYGVNGQRSNVNPWGGEPSYISIRAGQELIISGLPAGEYKIREVDAEVDSYELTVSYNDNSSVSVATVNVSNGTLTPVSITNTYTRDTVEGTLSVTKTVDTTNADGITVPTSFTFYVTNADGAYLTQNNGTTTAETTYTIAGGATFEFNHVPAGTYTVTEVTPAAIQGYSLVTRYTDNGAAIVNNGDSQTIGITNTYTRDTVEGTLSVTKTVDTTNADGITVPTSFTFYVTNADGAYLTQNNGTTTAETTYTIAGGATFEFNHVPAGTYTVTEVTPAAIQGYSLVTRYTDNGAAIVNNGDSQTIGITNTYTREQTQTGVGSLVIRKTVSGAALADLETISFIITGPNGYNRTEYLTFTNVQTGLWTVDENGAYCLTLTNLTEGGVYTVREDLDGNTSTYSLAASSTTSADSPAIVANGVVYVDLTNNYEENQTQPQPSPSNAPVEPTPTDVPTEPTPTETTPVETTPVETQPVVVSGSLIISKTISGTALNELETITFVLTDTSCGATREVPALTLENVANGLWGDAGNGTYYYIVTGLTPGVTYSVVESLDGHTSTYSLDVANSVTSGSATIISGDNVTVILTDAYTTGTTDGTTPEGETTPEESETTETTEPVEISSVTLDGNPLEPDSYTVNPDGTITLNDAIRRSLGAGRHDIVITYVNGASRTQTVFIDGADRALSSTGETSVNMVAAIIMLCSVALVLTARKLREEEN